jgi:hypothetical protein
VHIASGLPQPSDLLPKLGHLPVQIHEIFSAIDINNGPCAVTGSYPVGFINGSSEIRSVKNEARNGKEKRKGEILK